jgi:hypothetical protein
MRKSSAQKNTILSEKRIKDLFESRKSKTIIGVDLESWNFPEG